MNTPQSNTSRQVIIKVLANRAGLPTEITEQEMLGHAKLVGKDHSGRHDMILVQRIDQLPKRVTTPAMVLCEPHAKKSLQAQARNHVEKGHNNLKFVTPIGATLSIMTAIANMAV